MIEAFCTLFESATVGILLIYATALAEFLLDHLLETSRWRTLIIGGLLLGMTVATFFTIEAAKKDATEADALKTEVAEIRKIAEQESKKADEREKRLHPFIELAKKSAPGADTDAALKQLLTEFSAVKKDVEQEKKKVESVKKDLETEKMKVEAIRDYSLVAKLNMHGLTGAAGKGLRERATAISRLMEPALILENEVSTCRCDDNSLTVFKEVIRQYPKFPFSYFCIADCLKIRNNPEWKQYAIKAKDIFEITTSLSEHHQSHDQALQLLLRGL